MEVFAENTFMINAQSQHKDLAAEFLDLVVSKKQQQGMVRSQGPFAAYAGLSLANEPPAVQKLGQEISQYSKPTFMHVDHALPPQVSNPYLKSLQSVLAGSMSSLQAAKTTEAAAQQAQGPVKK